MDVEGFENVGTYMTYPDYGTYSTNVPSTTASDLPPSSPQADNTYWFAYSLGFDAPVRATRFAGASSRCAC